MRIEGAERAEVAGRVRLAADVIWETNKRSAQRVYFEVNEQHENALDDSPDAFLVACAPFAALQGEERLAVPGACPELAEGVQTGLRWLLNWYPSVVAPLQIEPSEAGSREYGDRQCACLLSGGIDSLAMLAANRMRAPEGGPSRFRAGVLVNWNVGTDRPDVIQGYRFLEEKRQRLEAFGHKIDLDVVTVYSNLMTLRDFEKGPLWGSVIHGAAFAGAANALAKRFRQVSIASSYDIPNLKAWGSHPHLDNNFSSTYLIFKHEGIRYSRLQKTELVAEWPEALEILNVCTSAYSARLQHWNCGRCEKCVRTALALMALGRLEEARTLGTDAVSPDTVQRIRVTKDVVASFWTDLAAGLRRHGHIELAHEVERKVARYQRRKKLRPIVAAISRVDQQLTGGRLRARLRGSGGASQRAGAR